MRRTQRDSHLGTVTVPPHTALFLERTEGATRSHPGLARLSREGSFVPLGTSPPVESPTSWASFSTGTNPGKHNVFDFIERKPDTYKPQPRLTSFEHGTFLWRLFPLRAAHATSRRAGTPFWSIASQQGLRTKVLTVPLTFPPDEVADGKYWRHARARRPRNASRMQCWASDLSQMRRAIRRGDLTAPEVPGRCGAGDARQAK